MRINNAWTVHEWLPVFLAMPRMPNELEQRPESGLLLRRRERMPRMMTVADTHGGHTVDSAARVGTRFRLGVPGGPGSGLSKAISWRSEP
jgi:Domain of unknown function (DUF4188)